MRPVPKKKKESKNARIAKNWIKAQTVKFILTIATILIADLMIVLMNKYILKLSGTYSRYMITFLGIFIVAFLFYSAFMNIERFSKFVVNHTVKMGKNYLGRKIGFYIVVFSLYLLLFMGYYWAWFNRNLIEDIYYDFF